MNFFERQERARRNTRLMLGLFLLALCASVLVVDVAAVVLWHLTNAYLMYRYVPLPAHFHAWVTGAVAGVILSFSIRKSWQVRKGGGMAIARMMGARQIVPLMASPLERRLLNIIEEMAIAAGTRVPLAYVLDEHGGINAFAAGFDGSMCVLVVTRGTLQRLNRVELQAVVGHEFSHMVNGDMELNLRMIGLLSGLVVIGAAGEHIIRKGHEDAGGTAPLFAFLAGGVIFVAGYTGLLFGRLIRAMIAREREFMADAGSVQYTRNPIGMAGALDQVRRSHSIVLNLHTEEVSHLFFAEAVYLEEERALSTHPPLQERIDHLVRNFRETDYRESRVDPVAELERELAPVPSFSAAIETGRRVVSPAQGVAMVGAFDDRDVRTAGAFFKALPPQAVAALQTVESASALALALVLSVQDPVLRRELDAVRAAGLESLAANTQPLIPLARELPAAWHLPVADLALAELKRQAESRRADFVRALEAVMGADEMVSVYRYACLNFMRWQLAPAGPGAGRKSIAEMRDEAVLILSLVAYASCADKSDFARAFEAGVKDMEMNGAVPVARERCDAQALTGALESLRELAPLAKARLVRGLFATVAADGAIRVVEAALMRMVGAVLDCPLPPLIDELDPEMLAA